MTTHAKILPTQERLKEVLDYNPETGAIVWIKRPAYNVEVGVPITCKRQGYIRFSFQGRQLVAHRLAWLFITGEDPGDLDIDHIDGDRANNAASNLRLATRSQNCLNRPGAKGFHQRKRDGRFEAYVYLQGKRVHLGLFDTAEEAREAYLAAKSITHGSFAPA